MRKTTIALVLAFNFILMNAQEHRDEFSLTNVYHHVGFTAIELVDPYLSVLNYLGPGISYEYQTSRFLNAENRAVSSVNRFTGLTAFTINPESTASIFYAGANGSWGMQYHYREFEDILLLAGANVDVDFGYKLNSRNINNPVNIDLSTNLNLTIGGRYFIPTRKRTIQLNAAFEFPVVGCMFVPYPGFSYYEMYTTKAYKEAIHVSSLHNKQGLKQYFSIDVPFNRSTWSFGIRKHDLKYKADDYTYSYSSYAIVIGITYDRIRFSGRKAEVPEIFVSPKY